MFPPDLVSPFVARKVLHELTPFVFFFNDVCIIIMIIMIIIIIDIYYNIFVLFTHIF